MVGSWIPLFRGEGYAVAEMKAATSWMAMNAAPPTNTKHLAALTAALRGMRAREKQKAAVLPSAGPVCKLCSGTARVIVPNHDVLNMTDDPLALKVSWTCAVVCRCPAGIWFRNQGGKAAEQMTLAEYERLCPDWRATMASIRAAERRRRDAETVAGARDRLALPGVFAARIAEAKRRSAGGK